MIYYPVVDNVHYSLLLNNERYPNTFKHFLHPFMLQCTFSINSYLKGCFHFLLDQIFTGIASFTLLGMKRVGLHYQSEYDSFYGEDTHGIIVHGK